MGADVIRPKSIATVVVACRRRRSGRRRRRSPGQVLLGVQRRDLADRADERGLTHPEAAGDEDLERGEGDVGGPSEGAEPIRTSFSMAVLAPGHGPLGETVIRPCPMRSAMKHADHPERQRGGGRHVGHGRRPRHSPRILRCSGDRPSESSGPWPSEEATMTVIRSSSMPRPALPAPGQRVGPDDRAGVPVDPLVSSGHDVLTPPGSARPGTGMRRQVRPGAFTSIAIS